MLASILCLTAILGAVALALQLKQEQLEKTPSGSPEARSRARRAHVTRLIERCETSLERQADPGLWERALRLRGLGPHASEKDVAAVRQLLDLPESELPVPVPLSFASAPHLNLQLTLLETRFSTASRVPATTPGAAVAETTAQLVWAARQHAKTPSAAAHAELARRLTQGLQLLNGALRPSDVDASKEAETLLLAQAIFRAAPLVNEATIESSVRHAFLSVITQLPRFVSPRASGDPADHSVAAQCVAVERRALAVETLATYLSMSSTRPAQAHAYLLTELDALVSELDAAGACERGSGDTLARSAAAAGALRALRLSRKTL